MNEKAIAKQAHSKILSVLFEKESNPTYELCRPTIENLTSKSELFLMEEYKLIRFVGVNCNGIEVFQVRS